MEAKKPNTENKKKRLNWGWGIAIFYSSFVVAILSFLFYSRTVNVDLVDENYYEKDLAYQGTIDRMNSAKALEQDVEATLSGDKLLISFPNVAPPEDITGNIRILRPSEKDFDILSEVTLDHSYQMSFPKAEMIGGKWVVQIEWEANGESYYYEKSMMVY